MTDRKSAAPPEPPSDPRRRVDDPRHADWEVDEASDESFPASDPPAFTGTTAGCADHSVAADDDDAEDDGRPRREGSAEERPDA